MRMLFIHRTMPGQFGRLASSLAGDGHEVVFVTRTVEQAIEGVRTIVYAPARLASGIRSTNVSHSVAVPSTGFAKHELEADRPTR